MNSWIPTQTYDVLQAKRRLLLMHYSSGVGHIGGNLSCLDALLVVFNEYLGSADRFVLSKGHSAGALYVALWSAGLLEDSDLETFHGDGTLLAGHPPSFGVPKIDFATGSLGHGFSLAAGLAFGARMKGQESNVVCLTSDGEWQEGSTWEALIFAAHHRLENLTVLVDQNGLQGFGTTSEVASMPSLSDRLVGFDVAVIEIDGHDRTAISEALALARARLTVVVLRTVKGHGVSFMENQLEWHYLPLTEELVRQALDELAG